MALWKKILLRSIGFGAGFALMLVVCGGFYLWWSGRPKPWSSTAITAKPTELSMNSQGETVHLRFRYALTNNTNKDYVVPGSGPASLMKKLPGESSIEKLDGATWDGTVQIPPKQSVNVTFDVPFELSAYNTTMAELQKGEKSDGDFLTNHYTAFLNKRMKEIDGLVLMDYSDRYRIELPSNWQNAK